MVGVIVMLYLDIALGKALGDSAKRSSASGNASSPAVRWAVAARASRNVSPSSATS